MGNLVNFIHESVHYDEVSLNRSVIVFQRFPFLAEMLVPGPEYESATVSVYVNFFLIANALYELQYALLLKIE